MFVFTENFKLYDGDYKPYGIDIEAATLLWHDHIRPVEQGMAIAAPGNKYFLKIPPVSRFSANFDFSFNYISESVGISLYVGYDRCTRSGRGITITWHRERSELDVALTDLLHDRDSGSEIRTVPATGFPLEGEIHRVALSSDGTRLCLTVDDNVDVTFDVELEEGAVGFSRPNFIGEVVYHSASIETDLEPCDLAPPVKVKIPTLEGGTMPLTVEYKLFTAGKQSYLTATLDGGPQYRPDYEYYDPDLTREQYVVEAWYMNRPYVSYGGNKYYLAMGNVNLSDGVHWKGILDVYLGIVELPVSITVAVEECDSPYTFGYEHLTVKGYAMQEGRGEYNFSKNGEYLGKTVFPDTFILASPEDKYAVSMIEDSVYDFETVRQHFKLAHYFAEDEAISFTLRKNTDKKYLTYRARLEDVFGDSIEELEVAPDGSILHTPLPIGVYRVNYTVLYGGRELETLDVVFEVYDRTGERCAPIESGLPVLYSTPNEQKYLDRDKFDPWNLGAPSNAEHFYALSSFLGYVGERKRVWEVIKKFGRKWYAWLTRRIYGTDAAASPELHPDVARNADYLRYDSDFWAGSYNFVYGRRTLPLLEDFLDGHEGAREYVGHSRGEVYDHKKHYLFMKKYGREWSDHLVSESVKAQRKTLAMLRTYNPDVKLAGYGPYAIYSSYLRSYSLLEYYSLPTDSDMHDLYFNGFCQFEDYPASCSYQTLRGPFGVGTMLAKMPNAVFYPEQYKSSVGGCIDGHVKHSNPPLGKYDMPIWFNVTLAREYVYNTAVKTKDGYRFWDTYGFMHGDHPEAQDDFFIRNWKYILRHKPKSVTRSPIYIAEFPKEESVYEENFSTVQNWRVWYNRSEEGIAHLYETSRLYGLPMGAYATWDALDTLTPEDTDLLVLPSTTSLSPERIDKLRELYRDGVSLFAVGRVDGLEDLFGVALAPHSEHIYSLEADSGNEDIYPYTDTFDYVSAGADVALSASGNPVYFTHGRTALLNLPAYSVGRTHFKEHPYLGRATNSALYYDVTAKLLHKLSTPDMTANAGCGITHFTDGLGRDILLAIDYSRHDQSEIYLEHEHAVTLNADYTDAISLDGKPIRKLISDDGRLDGIVVSLRQHESALIELIK